MEQLTILHDPQAELDYGFDWSLELLEGETIATSTWEINLVVTNDEPDTPPTLSNPTHNTNESTVWATGGTLRNVYLLTNHMVTSLDRKYDWSHRLICQNQ